MTVIASYVMDALHSAVTLDSLAAQCVYICILPCASRVVLMLDLSLSLLFSVHCDSRHCPGHMEHEGGL